MSTTLNKNVACTIFAKDDGMVIELENQRELTFFFNCIKFSDYKNEQEMLFIGGFSAIPFSSIINTQNKNNYGEFVKVLSTLSRLNVNKINTFSFSKKYLRVLDELVKHRIGQGSIRTDGIDSYVLGLFKHFCYNVDYIKFNMNVVNEDFLYVHKKRNTKCYGFKALYDIFFNAKLDIVNLPLVFNLYDNLEEITMEYWVTTQYGKSIDLSYRLMQYILDSLQTCSYLFKKFIISLMMSMTEENIQCPASHNLTQFETDIDDWSCDKCNAKFPKKTTMYICQFESDKTQCDYAICTKCRKSKNSSIIHLKQAISDYQLKFKAISWEITTEKYKNHKNDISDAICFSRI
eukprot:402298_1